MADSKPSPALGDSDVSSLSGYTMEKGIPKRTSNSYGNTQTKLPRDHAARRDAEPEVKSGPDY